MNEMRLIEVAALRCDVCPIGRGTASRQVSGALKTSHTTEQLRCDADLTGEYLDKMPLAQPEMRGKVSSPRFARSSSKDVQRGPNQRLGELQLSVPLGKEPRSGGSGGRPDSGA